MPHKRRRKCRPDKRERIRQVRPRRLEKPHAIHDRSTLNHDLKRRKCAHGLYRDHHGPATGYIALIRGRRISVHLPDALTLIRPTGNADSCSGVDTDVGRISASASGRAGRGGMKNRMPSMTGAPSITIQGAANVRMGCVVIITAQLPAKCQGKHFPGRADVHGASPDSSDYIITFLRVV